MISTINLLLRDVLDRINAYKLKVQMSDIAMVCLYFNGDNYFNINPFLDILLFYSFPQKYFLCLEK